MSISHAQLITRAHTLTADANCRQKRAARARAPSTLRHRNRHGRHARREAPSGGQELDPLELDQLDCAAAELGHELGPVRLAFGEALNALEHTHGYHELGFASLSTYAAEHAGKPKRWVAETRALAATLEHHSALRRQLMSGRLTWTRTELLAKLVEHSLSSHDITNAEAAQALRPALELSWFFRSFGLTCRELGERLRSLDLGTPQVRAEERVRYLTLTVPSEDTWWFHAAERTFRRVAQRTDLDAFLEALLAEMQNTLHPRASITHSDRDLEASDRWRSQLAQWRIQAEHLCERSRPALPRATRGAARQAARAWPRPQQLRTWAVPALHQHICKLAKQLHLTATALGRSAEQLHRVQAWRRLGFASAGHYARDRLGVSLSSLKQKRALVRRLSTLPRLAYALEAGHLGSVAASLVARVATTKTEQRWVERARQRTVKHLREEVAFVERVLRARPGHRGLPPGPEVMRAELALRGAVGSGRQFLRPQTKEQPGSTQILRAEPQCPPHQRDDAERQRLCQQAVHNYTVGADAACSRKNVSALPRALDVVARAQNSPSQRALQQSCGPRPNAPNQCIAGTRSESAANVAVAAGQTSVPENTDKLRRTPCSRAIRSCTSEATNPSRARHRHIMGDGLSVGRVRLRVRVHESTLLLYRDVARMFACQHPRDRLLRSLCEHFLTVWGPVVARKHGRKYEHIYERDGYQCTSPVCDRHDVTPHHLKFRSRGGGDEATNLTSLCVWCHLEGVHGGRIRAEPQPDGIKWTIGRVAPIYVDDRHKQPPLS